MGEKLIKKYNIHQIYVLYISNTTRRMSTDTDLPIYQLFTYTVTGCAFISKSLPKEIMKNNNIICCHVDMSDMLCPTEGQNFLYNNCECPVGRGFEKNEYYLHIFVDKIHAKTQCDFVRGDWCCDVESVCFDINEIDWINSETKKATLPEAITPLFDITKFIKKKK